MDFPALFKIADGRHTHAPMVLDAGKIIFRSEKDIQAVAGDRQAELFGFLRAGFDHFRRDIFVKFNNLEPAAFFLRTVSRASSGVLIK